MSYTTTIAEAVAELDRYDAIIDVRSPAEFAEDHMPGALNWPVLDDQERHDVGLLYATSPFEARKLGSALVARNIARHIETSAVAYPKTWRPLVYCWRGGQRSGSMHWFLGQIGFRSRQLAGGYKAYRSQVRDDLQAWPARFDWRVLCGRTGSGKTRLLHALAAEGAQVLDLEALAAHRGSVLGALVDAGAELIVSGHVHQSAVGERREFEVVQAPVHGTTVVTAPGLGQPRPRRRGEARGLHLYEADERMLRVLTYAWVDGDWALIADRRFPRGSRPLEASG